MDATDSRAVPIYPALVRPILVGGIERPVAILLSAAVVALLFAFRLNWLTPTLAALLVAFGFPRLRRLNQRDPQAFAVLLGHLRRAGLYRSQALHDERRTSPPPTF